MTKDETSGVDIEDERAAFFKGGPFFIKSLNVSGSRVPDFLGGISASTVAEEKAEEKAEPKEKAPLRHLARKKYIVKEGAVLVRYAGKLYYTDANGNPNLLARRPPRHTKEAKAGFSTPQSTSFISADTPEKPIFLPGKNEAYIGVAFSMDATLEHGYYNLSDGGTIGRRNEFDSFQEAQEFLENTHNKTVFIDLEAFKEALRRAKAEGLGQKGIFHHNEVLMRLRWTPGCRVMIFADSLDSRLAAEHLAREISQLYGVEKPDIYFYIPGNPKNYTQYDAQQLQADKASASRVISNETVLRKLFEHGNFLFLLGIDDRASLAEVLSAKTTQGTSRLFDLYMQGHVFYATALAKQAGIDLESQLSSFEDYPSVISPTVILDIALHYPELYLRLPAEIVHNEGSGVNATLRYAASWGKADAVSALLMHREIDIGENVLENPIKRGHVKILKLLLDDPRHGAALGERIRHGAALRLAIEKSSGHTEIVQLLLDAGVSSAAIPEALGCAAELGHAEVVTLLLQQRGASVDQAPKNGVAPLLIAAKKGYTAVMRVLLEHDAAINQANAAGATPLFLAAEGGHVEAVKLLLAKHAAIDYPNAEGVTPLQAAEANGHPEIALWIQKASLVITLHNYLKVNQRDRFLPSAEAEEKSMAEALLCVLTGKSPSVDWEAIDKMSQKSQKFEEICSAARRLLQIEQQVVGVLPEPLVHRQP